MHPAGCVALQLPTSKDVVFVARCRPGASTAIIDRLSHSQALTSAFGYRRAPWTSL